VSGRYDGASRTADGKTCHINTVKFENGIVGTYYNVIGRWSPFHITVMTTKQTRSFVIDTLRIYQPMLREICKEMSTGKSGLADVEPILDDYIFVNRGRILQAGSADAAREESGKSLDELFREVFKCLPSF
jgi:hypothetical protein